jgi:transformation/transcription domain-associated protein
MVSYLAFIMRVLGEQGEVYGDPLIIVCFRLLQDCPANAIVSRKVCYACFRPHCTVLNNPA